MTTENELDQAWRTIRHTQEMNRRLVRAGSPDERYSAFFDMGLLIGQRMISPEQAIAMTRRAAASGPLADPCRRALYVGIVHGNLAIGADPDLSSLYFLTSQSTAHPCAAVRRAALAAIEAIVSPSVGGSFLSSEPRTQQPTRSTLSTHTLSLDPDFRYI
jgi:hypothetical protein